MKLQEDGKKHKTLAKIISQTKQTKEKKKKQATYMAMENKSYNLQT